MTLEERFWSAVMEATGLTVDEIEQAIQDGRLSFSECNSDVSADSKKIPITFEEIEL